MQGKLTTPIASSTLQCIIRLFKAPILVSGHNKPREPQTLLFRIPVVALIPRSVQVLLSIIFLPKPRSDLIESKIVTGILYSA